MALEQVNIPLPAQKNSGLRAAQQLIPGKGQHVHTGSDRILHSGFPLNTQWGQIHKAAAAQIFNHRDAAGAAQLRQRGGGNAFREPDDTVVAGVYLQKSAGIFADGGLIVGKAGLVGSAHLPQHCAAGGHDVRHPEGAADLYQLSAGGDDLPAGGEGGEGQQNRCRVVVDHQRRLRAGKAAQQGLHMGIPLSPPAGGQVVFQRGITAGNILCRPQCAAAQSSPPQIGMKYHAGCVDDAAEGRKPGAPAGFRDLGAEGFLTGQLRDRAGENVFPQGVQRPADSLRHRRRRSFRRQRFQRGAAEQIINFRNPAQQLFIHRNLHICSYILYHNAFLKGCKPKNLRMRRQKCCKLPHIFPVQKADARLPANMPLLAARILRRIPKLPNGRECAILILTVLCGETTGEEESQWIRSRV